MTDFSFEYYKNLESSWEFLKKTDLPVFIYGMGDGALKILKQFDHKGIACGGFFASDEFVRGHYFEGHLVHKLSEIENNVGEFVVVLAFAAGYKSLIDKIIDISSKHILFAPDVPVFGENIFTKEFLEENFDKFEKVYEMLEDEKSKKVFKSTIEYKITGRINHLIDNFTDVSEAYQNILGLSRNETYIDLGAYRGDTIEEFLKYTSNSYERIIALEPEKRNFKKLEQCVLNLKNTEIFNCAAWKYDDTLTFSYNPGRQASLDKKGKAVQARAVDSILSGDKATYIKYDVEGSENEALLGSKYTIEKFNPKLTVAIYHRSEDLFEIPLLIKKFNPSYKLYLRHFPYIPAWEVNLFAI